MKILQVIHQSLPTWVGGVEVYTHGLAKALGQRGHQVQVFVRETRPSSASPLGLEADDYEDVRVNRLYAAPRTEAAQWASTFGDAPTLAAFIQTLETFRPDLVHFQHLMGLPAAVVDEVQRRRLPFIITLHDYWFVCANTKLLTNYSNQPCSGPRAWINCGMCGLAKAGAGWAVPVAPLVAPLFALRHWRVRQILHQANALIAPTAFVRDTFIQQGVSAEQIHVIDYGIEPPPLVALPLPDHGPLRVAYAGGAALLKGAHVLVEAFNTLPPDAQLRIAGDLNRQPEYTRRLQRLTRHPGVRYLGPQSRAELWALLQWADLVAVPSIWYEVSPLIIHEAFAMRRPVIASRLGSLAGRVRDGVDGILAPPDDSQAWGQALAALAHDRQQLLRFQDAIRPMRTVAQHIEELEQLYRMHLPKDNAL